MRYISNATFNLDSSSTERAPSANSFDALDSATNHGGQVQPQTLEGLTMFEYPALPNDSGVWSSIPTSLQGAPDYERGSHAYGSTTRDVPIDPVLAFDDGYHHNLLQHECLPFDAGLIFHNSAACESVPPSTSAYHVSGYTASPPSSDSSAGSTRSSPPLLTPINDYDPNPMHDFNEPLLLFPPFHASLQTGLGDAFTQVDVQSKTMTMPLSCQPQDELFSSNTPLILGTATKEISVPQSNDASMSTTLATNDPCIPSTVAGPSADGGIGKKKRGKSRSSLSQELAASKRRTGKECSPKSRVPCTDASCKKLFHDKKTMLRHVDDEHNPDKDPWFCPGLCKAREAWMQKCNHRSGYSRSDSLLRHLGAAKENDLCRIEAMKLGWEPKKARSIESLKGFRPV